jgi:hypothetical protein
VLTTYIDIALQKVAILICVASLYEHSVTSAATTDHITIPFLLPGIMACHSEQMAGMESG